MYSYIDIHVVHPSEEYFGICELIAVHLRDENGVGIYRLSGEDKNLRIFFKYLWAPVTYVELDRVCENIKPIGSFYGSLNPEQLKAIRAWRGDDTVIDGPRFLI